MNRHRNFQKTILATLVAASIVLAGCVSTAGIAPAAKPIAPNAVGLNGELTLETIAVDWWREFGDPGLIAIVDRALAGSPTLGAASARVMRAQAAIANARAADLPQVAGDASATREKFSAHSIYPPPLGGSTQTVVSAQIGATWELDFFGKNRAAIDAAIGAERAAQADADAARVLLATQVARQYVQLSRLFELRRVAVRTVEQRTQTLDLIRQRVAGGLDTNVELRQGEASLPEARRQIEQLDEQIALTRHALAALAAQPYDAYDQLEPALSTPSHLAIPANVPADLLGRRADVQAARWRIEAATGEVAGAKAQFYPNVNLIAFVGLASIGFSPLLKSGSDQWGVGPAIHLPIFDAGRLRANLRGKTADLDLAVETYNAAVLDAVRDVADQIASLRSLERQRAEQAATLAAAESAYDLAGQRFRAGLATYLTVLSTESSVLTERRLAADLQARDLDARIALVRALGGGYTAPDSAAALRTATVRAG